MLKVAIATTSPEKIAGVKIAVLRFFNLEESEVEFNCMSTNSGVSDQPLVRKPMRELRTEYVALGRNFRRWTSILAVKLV